MRFLIDAQLPPALAEALRKNGADAVHVAELGMAAALDHHIWQESESRSAVLVTKDRDFSVLRAARPGGPVVVWIRLGNVSNRELIARVIRTLPQIADAVRRGEAVIELV